ncbi:DUF1538 domain-containing protein [Maridesulfovibrio hydrothermalis]|uniref:DUF1538 domain-containing protein n=1 Tax=Maridesulfovibrio hydrothermalis AM13 = DSM 14728 TaxID=1121451 RepID=L0RC12_9BACT|nr:DUF1538 domain-containing protein [Maridesulfovibrio hydrothermalis]CCO23730.1 conserved membrane protein of unknown function [Maridesulfovibrio hydrothermalis AM13 = DSM 14728]
MAFLIEFGMVFLATIRDILPILILITCFQLFVLRQSIPNLRSLIIGGIYVVLGLAMFLIGLEKALFPVGKIMATQLSAPSLLAGEGGVAAQLDWTDYGWVYLFAAMIGFSTTIAEPSLLAVAIKAKEVSGGVISQWGLRITVAVGVAFGISLGAFRIVTGTPLYIYILAGYVIVIIQTFLAPKKIIALAYDSGGVTTSTVTVPLVAALGLGLSESVPGRNPALDGFGLIAFASLFPIITVMGYAQYTHFKAGRKAKTAAKTKKAGNPAYNNSSQRQDPAS